MGTNNFAVLEDACTRSAEYPRSLERTKTPEHTIRVLQHELKRRTELLFSNEHDAAVNFWELFRVDEGINATLDRSTSLTIQK